MSRGEAAAAPRPISLRAYARRRGTSVQSVSRAVKSGRLKECLVFVDGVAQIADPDLADREWAAHTDHSRAPGYVKERESARAVAVSPGTPEAGTPGTAHAAGSPRVTRVSPADVSARSLAAASTREKNARANLAELEYQAKAGELVSAKAVEAAWTEMVSQMRAAVLSVPSKAKAEIPTMTHADLAKLNELLYQALEGLADRAKAGRPNGAAA